MRHRSLTQILVILALVLISNMVISQQFKQISNNLYQLNITQMEGGDVLNLITQNSDYKIAYAKEHNDKMKAPITVNMNGSIDEILKVVLKSYNIQYVIKDKQIVLKFPGNGEDAHTMKNLHTTNEKQGGEDTEIPDDSNPSIVSNSAVGGGNNTLNTYKTDVDSISGNKQLEEVVVTALGIKRETKALGYAVSTVAGDKVQNFSKTNPLEALSGQVAGLDISSSGSGAGGSNKITIRGVSSLTGSNDPLYVVDGIPFNNNGGANGGQFGGNDWGNAINDINPDDIESISVLKGGAAAALYGSRGQNGVIMITTKRGKSKDKGLGVNYSYQLQTHTPSIIPQFQDQYSQGDGGKFIATSPNSWGEKMQGQQVTNFLGQSQNLSSTGNPYKEFFKTGITHNHNVSFSKVYDNTGVYASYSNMQESGIVPGNKIEKNSIVLRANTILGNFITIDAKANYIDLKGNNRPDIGGSPDNPVYGMYYLPRSVGLGMLQPYQTNLGYPIIWTEPYTTSSTGDIFTPGVSFAKSPLVNNPYWSIYNKHNNDLRRRITGFASATIDFEKLFHLNFDLNLMIRAGMDYYYTQQFGYIPTNTYYKIQGLATIFDNTSNFLEANYDFLLNGGKRFGKFGFTASFGGNLMNRKMNVLNASSEAGVINSVGPYVIQNFNAIQTAQGISEQEIQSLYGMATLDWDNQVFLDVTARNDWTSVLSSLNRSIFYPSVSVSWLINETFQLPKIINLLKIRASWAQVGSGGNSSNRYYVYSTNPNQYYGLPYGTIPSIRPNPDLMNELTISYEGGLNLIMFDNRLNIDLSYFQRGTKNQILNAAIAPSAGFNTGYINAGYISNSGVEAQIRGSMIRKKDMELYAGFNFTYLWNKVQKLPPDVTNLSLGGFNGVNIIARNGLPVGTILGTAFAKDEAGNLILDNNNLPTMQQNSGGSTNVNVELGKIYPDYLLGFTMGFRYKVFSISFLIDGKLNYNIYSYSNAIGSRNGVLANTVAGRDEYAKAKEVYDQTGVLPNIGYMVSGVKNGVYGEYAVDPQQYWTRVSGIVENWVYDASFIRLRQINVSYNLSKSIHKIKFMGDIIFNAAFNNVFYIFKNTPNIIPESSSSTGNASGLEAFAMPAVFQFVFGVNISF